MLPSICVQEPIEDDKIYREENNRSVTRLTWLSGARWMVVEKQARGWNGRKRLLRLFTVSARRMGYP